jgi:hypothetical protein
LKRKSAPVGQMFEYLVPGMYFKGSNEKIWQGRQIIVDQK